MYSTESGGEMWPGGFGSILLLFLDNNTHLDRLTAELDGVVSETRDHGETRREEARDDKKRRKKVDVGRLSSTLPNSRALFNNLNFFKFTSTREITRAPYVKGLVFRYLLTR